jgi:adenylosuccinate synthase
VLRGVGQDPGAAAREACAAGERLVRFAADTSALLNGWIDEGKSVLFEGAQGTMLDLDHGSYPFVTSSNTLAGGLCAGLGVAPTRVDGAIGVFKAYATRVGGGPLPTELADGPGGLGERLRQRGREYGTTTGRPRRCGWFDGVAAAYAQRLNRFDAACVTLLDVLDAFSEVRICVAYRFEGGQTRGVPAAADLAESWEPVYETLPGWRRDLSGIRTWTDLPAECRAYLDRIEKVSGAEVALVSVGPDRSQSIVRPGSWLQRTLGI